MSKMKKSLPTAMLLVVGIAGSAANSAPSAAPSAGTLSNYPPEPKSPDQGKEHLVCGYYEKSVSQEYLGSGHYGPLEIGMGGSGLAETNCK